MIYFVMVMYTMLDIKIGQLVELSDNNEYSVVSRVENNEKTYYRLLWRTFVRRSHHRRIGTKVMRG